MRIYVKGKLLILRIVIKVAFILIALNYGIGLKSAKTNTYPKCIYINNSKSQDATMQIVSD